LALRSQRLRRWCPRRRCWPACLSLASSCWRCWTRRWLRAVSKASAVELPQVVRLAKDREGAIEVQVKNEKQRTKRLPARSAVAARNLFAGRRFVGRRCRRAAGCRGCVALHAVEARQLSTGKLLPRSRVAVGLWRCALAAGARGDSRVSNLLTERKVCGAVSQSRPVRRARPTADRQRPRLRETAGLRSRRQFRGRHWKATAKRGRPRDQKSFKSNELRKSNVYRRVAAQRARQWKAGSRRSRVESRFRRVFPRSPFHDPRLRLWNVSSPRR